MRTIDPLDLPKAERPVLSESAEDAGYYFNARWYSPERGAFIGRDPALQFWSPYSYTGNTPLAGVDPDGRAVIYDNGVSATSFQNWMAALPTQYQSTYQGFVSSETQYPASQMIKGYAVLQEAWKYVGSNRNEGVQSDGYRHDCSGMVSMILDNAVSAGLGKQSAGGVNSSVFRKMPEAGQDDVLPGTIFSFSGHVGIYDPLNGSGDRTFLSMTGRGNNGSFTYRSTEWWNNEKDVQIPGMVPQAYLGQSNANFSFDLKVSAGSQSGSTFFGAYSTGGSK
jgi:hypothetical protein